MSERSAQRPAQRPRGPSTFDGNGYTNADHLEHGSGDRVSGGDADRATLLTADELAERWRVSKAQVYRLARDGRVPTVAIGRYYRFRLASIEAWELEHEARVG
jgi:excisionase family DNA binding protein